MYEDYKCICFETNIFRRTLFENVFECHSFGARFGLSTIAVFVPDTILELGVRKIIVQPFWKAEYGKRPVI